MAALAALAGAICFFWRGGESVLLGGADTGWLIRTGDYINSAGRLPQHDIFTWTCAGQKFICYQWLFECVVSYLCKLGGLGLVGLCTYILVAFLYLFAMPLIWVKQGVKPCYTALFMLPALTPFWFFARPQLISYWAIFATVLILERWRKNKQSKLIFALPPIALIWTNMHCVAIMVPLLTLIYLLDQAVLQKPKKSQPENLKKELIVPGLVLGLSLAALFVTPLDLPTIFAGLTVAGRTDMAACNELKPLYLTTYLFQLSNLYVIGAIIALIVGRKKVPTVGWIIAPLALLSGLLVARLQPVGVLLSWPFVGIALSSAGYRMTESANRFLATERILIWPSGVLALALALWFSRFPFAETNSSQDRALLTFLGTRPALSLAAANLNSDNKVFNDTVSGSRLIFLKGPPVFIDGRLFVFEHEFYNEWLSAMNLQTAWPAFADKWKIDSVVLSRGNALYDELMRSSEWRLCIDDGGTSFWIKGGKVNCKFDPEKPETLSLSTDELTHDRVALAAKHYQSAKIFFDAGRMPEAVAEIDRSLVQLETKNARELKSRIDQQFKK